MSRWLMKFIPYLYMGIMLAAAIIGFMIFSWLFVVGALVGGLLFLASYLRRRFFTQPRQSSVTRAPYSTEQPGRIIEHDARDDHS